MKRPCYKSVMQHNDDKGLCTPHISSMCDATSLPSQPAAGKVTSKYSCNFYCSLAMQRMHIKCHTPTVLNTCAHKTASPSY